MSSSLPRKTIHMGCFAPNEINADYSYNPPVGPLKILYADEEVLVVNKPTGLLTVPGKKSTDSLTTRIKEQLPLANPVHRLDTSTSGIVLYAKDQASCAFLSEEFRCRRPIKRYCAWVWGVVKEPFGLIDYPLAKDQVRSSKFSAPYQKVDYVNGRTALTYFEVLERDIAREITLVALTPHTGRTHQLRVHMAYWGHPIVGDALYANEVARQMAPALCLHAFYLAFSRPKDGAKVRVFCPPNFAAGFVPKTLYAPE